MTQITDNRDEFEAAYAAHWGAATGTKRMAAEVAKLRNGAEYGDRAYLNGMWAGWQLAQSAQADARVALTISTDECAPDVYKHGKSVGLFDIPKETANEICAGITAITGARVDWHYIAGRVHMMALANAAAAPSPADERAALLAWAVERWDAEVKNRPLVNVHRRSLDDTWRQVIRHCGGDDVSLLRPRHDDLIAPAAAPIEGMERAFTSAAFGRRDELNLADRHAETPRLLALLGPKVIDGISSYDTRIEIERALSSAAAPSPADERAAFEVWAANKGHRFNVGDLNHCKSWAWAAWQARATHDRA